MLYRAGLAYQSEALVNYDPVDKTVLANEQVDSNGCSWRSGAKVEKKMLKQWFFKISEFRQELLDGLTTLQGKWPERVLAMQKNWLGKSVGARIKFPVVAPDEQAYPDIEVFTTRPDTLFGVQYVALASAHPVVQSLAKKDAGLRAFLDTIQALPKDSKVGYLLPHVSAQNPLSSEDSTRDATKASLPIYVAPYVLGDYSDGAVMGVPGHDTRDHLFWKHNRHDDPIRAVISHSAADKASDSKAEPFVHHGFLTEDSGSFAGLSSAEAKQRIIALLASKGLAEAAETWRLRDWLVSRQRYWGTPIPIIHCDTCGPVPVPDDQLPIELPPVDSHWEAGKTGNPLEHAHSWVNTTCPECGGVGKRDTDTMDTFVDSSWYFMRFPDAHNSHSLFSPESANANLPVDLYVGGVEHAILHLLYARFISKFIATTSLWPEGSKHLGEPFQTLLAQGMVHGKTYSDPSTKRFLKPDEVDASNPSQPIVLATNEVANVSFEKMSKSKYNGVDPSTCIAKYGADATRAHILFQAPVGEVLNWDEEKIAGVTRWLHKLRAFVDKYEKLWMVEDLKSYQFNPKMYFINGEPPRHVPDNWEGLMPSISHASEKRLAELRLIYGWSSRHHDQSMRATMKAWTKMVDKDKALWRSVQHTIASVTESYGKTYSLNTVVSDLMTLTSTIIEYHDTNINAEDPTLQTADYRLALHATRALVQMIAPIAPAVAEDCWARVRPVEITPIFLLKWKLFLSISKMVTSMKHLRWADLPRIFLNRVVQRVFNAASAPEPQQMPSDPSAGREWPELRPCAGSVHQQPFPTVDDTFAILAPSTHKCAVQINGKVRVVVEIAKPEEGLQGVQLEKWVVEQILWTNEGRAKLMGDGPLAVDIRKAKKTIVVKGGKTANFVM